MPSSILTTGFIAGILDTTFFICARASARPFSSMSKAAFTFTKGQWPHKLVELINREAPERFTLPTGRRARLRYDVGKPPVLSARLQDLFGLQQTPRLAGGRILCVVEILAPNQRPVQITQDLAGFWTNTYPLVRKELRGRYPKHAWPEI